MALLRAGQSGLPSRLQHTLLPIAPITGAATDCTWRWLLRQSDEPVIKTDLLILDEWGMQSLSGTHRQDLMEVIEDRHGRRSTLIASQLPIDHWHEFIGEATLADAILDRLLHGANRLVLKGESMRKREPDLTDRDRSE